MLLSFLWTSHVYRLEHSVILIFSFQNMARENFHCTWIIVSSEILLSWQIDLSENYPPRLTSQAPWSVHSFEEESWLRICHEVLCTFYKPIHSYSFSFSFCHYMKYNYETGTTSKIILKLKLFTYLTTLKYITPCFSTILFITRVILNFVFISDRQ